MKQLFFLLLFFTGNHVYAQKKLVPVSQSIMTGIHLPDGSKQDKRLLMELSARVLLEMESKRYGTGVTDTEVFYLPPVSVSNYNSDSLVAQFSTLAWNITPVETDNKYVWLQKDNRFVIVYFSMDKKETAVYFGLAATPPALNGGSNQ